MKKSYLNLLLAVSVIAFGLSSCGKDKKDAESGPVTKFDQLGFLQSSLVRLDSVGQFVERVNGVPVWPEDTNKIAIAAADLADAKAIFKGLLAPDSKFDENGDNITVNLTDEQGKSQGVAKFEAADGADGVCAKVTLPVDIKFVSSLLFIKQAEWPTNNADGESPYSVGAIVAMDTYNEGVQNWICIREASPSCEGLLIYRSHNTYSGGWTSSAKQNYASEGQASTIAGLLKANWAFFKQVSSDAGMAISDGHEYWINKQSWFGYPYVVKLPNGSFDWYNPHAGASRMRSYLQCKSFKYRYL